MYRIISNLKEVVISLILLLILLTSSTYGQTAYYYSDGGKLFLDISSREIVAKLTDQAKQNIDMFVKSDPAFDTTKIPEPRINGFFSVYLRPEVDIADLLTRLDTNTYVLAANPLCLLDSTEFVITDEFIVKFNPVIPRSEIDSFNAVHNIVVTDSLTLIRNLFLLKITPASDFNTLDMANLYYEDSRTIYSVPNAQFLLSPFQETVNIGTDPYFKYQYNYHNTGYTGGKVDADIDGKETWRDFIVGDSTIIIAVIDEGIEAHEDLLADRLIKGYDWAGDDLYGPPPLNKPDDDPSPGDSCRYCPHGMACAGLIAATRNAIGIAGLDLYCKIIPVKIWDNNGFKADDWYIGQAIFYADTSGADILSCSWGHSYNDFIEDCIQSAYNNGCLLVFAAGNQGLKGGISFPATMDEVLAVGATDKFDQVCLYSSRGVELDVVAPGGEIERGCDWSDQSYGDIYSIDLSGSLGYNELWDECDIDLDNLNYTGKFSGTSAACPQVAGMAGMIKAYAKKIRNGITNDTLMMVIRYSAEDSMYYAESDTNWDDIHIGYGRVNLYRAMIAISRGDANHNDVVTIADAVYIATYLYQGGFPPVPIPEMGDANCDGVVTNADIVYIINFLFKGGDPPKICFKYISDWP